MLLRDKNVNDKVTHIQKVLHHTVIGTFYLIVDGTTAFI